MKSTSRLRVLSDRIPRVLVFDYFCRGLSGNKEERPTRRDYIEILTCRVKASTVSVRLRIICVRINTIGHSSATLGMTT